MKTIGKKKKVAVIGLGYVGLPLALLASKKGYEVYGIDLDTKKVEKINNKQSPFLDERIEQDIKKTKLRAVTDFSIIRDCEIVIICVPTPVNEDKSPDLSYVEKTSESIAKHIKKGTLVILESTVNPGVCENIVIPIIERGSSLKAGEDFYVAHCPERINPGDKKWSVKNINRVLGSLEEKGLKIAKNFYSSVIDGEIYTMGSLKEAEAVKIVENSFRDINIAFVNELARSFYKMGIDVVNVINGAKTKPFSFMAHYPGCGVGGHCIPVDPYYLIEDAKKNGFDHVFLSNARKINNDMPKFTVELFTESIKEKNINPSDAKVAVLGISYKADIDDYRESPSFHIVEELKEQGYKVKVFDPFVPSKSTVPNLEEALRDVDGVIIATDHTQFKKLKPELFIKNGIEIIVDGRNCLDKEKFVDSKIIYKGIGRQ
ncbi:MAG TPA: nucleotide sugar dehydrogenase [Candidatus Paceibacterota bacterium]|nr:nucleotide sugar dehydrogenase [Candidatus Paceibacterota bacterium]